MSLPSQRRQIALVVHDFATGFGHGRYCVELARRLAPHHGVHIFANHFGVPCEAYWTYHRVPAWRRSALLTIITFLANAGRRIAHQRFDIIHAQGLTCRQANVITAHVCNAARVEQDSLRSPKHRLFDTLAGQLETEFYRRNAGARWIAVSQQTARELVTFQEPAQPVRTIYHGVDSDHFRPLASIADKERLRETLGLPTDRWLWLFVGEASKGLQPALTALAHFPQASLLVVSRSAATEWLETAARLGVLDRLIWIGPQAELLPFYQTADVLVYPSQYDTFGMVVAEAMSAGLPVVTSNSIGAAEWITHGENGLVGEAFKAVALVSLLEQLAALADRGAALGAKARVTAQFHSWDACVAATLETYQEVWTSAQP
jgi:UDP-glucose:(heptosyl)LPS alpha-1,3-glucosyltransferase